VAVTLRPMVEADLGLVEAWLQEPHVARWWLHGSTLEAELAEFSTTKLAEPGGTSVLVVLLDDRPVGWLQWYCYDDYPDEGAAMGAAPGDLGIDYAIGDPTAVGRGIGTQMIAAAVSFLRTLRPGAGIMVDPDAANGASRRVLEHNGFELVAVRPVATEPRPDPVAIYRLPAERVNGERRPPPS
jgi:aminoglycoside 6'-N-acetyltransferase